MNHRLGRLVAVILENSSVVVPVTNAGVCLPGIWKNVVRATAFYVQHHGANVLGLQFLRVDHRLELSVPRDVAVVEMCSDVEPGLLERKFRVVEIEQVRLIPVHEILAAEKPGPNK